MKHLLIVTVPAFLLAGCAKDYDQAAVPGANVAMQISSERCEARRAANDFKTFSELEQCQLAAERDFALAIHLKKMDVFESYAAQMRTLASDRDANRVTPQQARLQADAIRSTFIADCSCKPKSSARWTGDYMPGGTNAIWNTGPDVGAGPAGHAMGPGPGNFPQ